MVLFKGDADGAAEFFPFQVRNNNIKLTPLADFFTREGKGIQFTPSAPQAEIALGCLPVFDNDTHGET